MSPIAPGAPVPPFSLKDEDEMPFDGSDLLGKNSVLVFYPFAFSPVCTHQLNLYDDLRDQFAEHDAVLYGISCDSVWTQRAFKEKLGIQMDQLSDFEPKGETCRAFGVYHPGGFPQRALIIVGPDGVVKWSYQAESPGDLPGANLIFDALTSG